MATREFKDAAGRTWTVWEVRPIPGPGRRAAVQAEFECGWLTCETTDEKRRVAPIPPAWEELPDDALERLCARGSLVRPVLRGRRGAGGQSSSTSPYEG